MSTGRAARGVGATLVVAVAIAGAIGAKRTLLPEGRLLPGLRIEGLAVPDDVARANDDVLRAWIAARISPRLARDVEIVAGKRSQKVAIASMVLAPAIDAAIAQARRLGHAGALDEDFADALRVRSGAVDVRTTIEPDFKAIEAIATTLKDQTDDAPRDAKLDLDAHAVLDDVPGHLLDLDGAVATIASAAHALASDSASSDAVTTTTIPLAIISTPAHVTRDALTKIDISTVVSTFETHFGRFGDQAPRAGNIENAARKLNGLVLEPGQLVSFNGVVGERSEANGFKVAWEIFKGEMRPGVGGGTCQVASTLHAAAMFGGVEILERLPHSRPSAYITMGLDSTVVFPVVDLKLKNPHAFPLVVHTKVREGTLTIELLGASKPVEVTFSRDVVEVLPFKRRIDEEASVLAGHAIKKQAGIRGYRVRRVRTIKPTGGGVARTEVSTDFYPPTTEIYQVAPGSDPRDLPALPEDVAQMLAEKEAAKAAATSGTAVACAGACGAEAMSPSAEGATPAPGASATAPPSSPVEVHLGAGVHDAVGDQAAPSKSVLIRR
ncbi:MAG: VanW family protein [Polyangiales bacterium]